MVVNELAPPIVVLPDPLGYSPGPGLFGAEAALAGEALGVLEKFSAFDDVQTRDAILRLAIRHLERIETAPLPGIDVTEAARTPVQQYFRIRTADIDAKRAAIETVGIAARSLDDLRSAPISGASMMREVAAIRQTVRDAGAVRIVESADEVQTVFTPSPPHTSQRWYDRWILAHQLHALFNVSAALAVRGAIDSLSVSDIEAACQQFRRATIYVEGFSASRAHALAIPPWFYNDILRPSMMPPLSSAPLSGRMHSEYRAYRTQIARLTRDFPEAMIELVQHEPELALVREALLDADLVDAENHVCLVEPVVGQSKSLVQSAKSLGNALSALRKIRDRRASMIAPFVRGIDSDVAGDYES